ncbi:MAG: hypothetical protein IKO02_08265, partial [Lentisphaeria bacterium]|nr:hypothetical protein [Lentisphaeria bacterium]
LIWSGMHTLRTPLAAEFLHTHFPITIIACAVFSSVFSCAAYTFSGETAGKCDLVKFAGQVSAREHYGAHPVEKRRKTVSSRA